MPDIEAELRRLSQTLTETLQDSLLAAEITGAGDVAASVPASHLPTPGPGVLPPSVPPITPSPQTMFGRPPRITFPAVDSAVSKLTTAPAFAGTDFRATAEAVRNGAFAITTDLGHETVNDIRELLRDNVRTGPDMGRFIADVQGLLEEGTGFSEARLDMVFRNNVGQSLLDGQERALRNPLVVDAFPYRRKYATKDTRVRPEHLLLESAGLNGTAIYNMNDPVWQTFRGRWNFNCRCSDGPMTVEMAARAGVEEAKAWLERAQRQADQFGGVAAQYLGETAPAAFEFVPWPTMNGIPVMPPPEFRRNDGPVQFSEWQLAKQAGKCWQLSEFDEAKHKRDAGGQFAKQEGQENTTDVENILDDVINERISNTQAKKQLQKAGLWSPENITRFSDAKNERYLKVLERDRIKERKEAEKQQRAIESIEAMKSALLERGATLKYESPSGSMYFELTDGRRVRVSDHAVPETEWRRFTKQSDVNDEDIIFSGRAAADKAVAAALASLE